MSLEALKRLYNIADAYMIEFAKTLRLFFIEDQAAFTAEDSNFATPFEANWQTVIDTAEAEPTDEQRKDQLMQLTETTLEEMDLCRECFQGSKRYIKKAFPNNITIWNEFGFDDYDDIERKHPEMIQFMKRFHSTAVKYSAQLGTPAVNFDAAKIAEIETRRAALDAANNAQEKFKKDIPTYTQQRIQKLNAVWEICTDVGGVGKSLFKDDYAKYQHYLLPASEETESFMLSGTVTEVATAGNPDPAGIEEVTVTVVELALTTETDSNGSYGFGILPPGTYTLQLSKTGYVTQNIPGIVITEDSELEQDAELALAAGTGTVSGHVTLTGADVLGVMVSVIGFPLLTATTNASGNYTILNVPAGAQSVQATPPPPGPGMPQTQNVTVTAGGTVTVNFSF
jgi:hypothetical protein